MIRTTYEVKASLKAPCLLCGWPMTWHAMPASGHGCPPESDPLVAGAWGSTSPSGSRCVRPKGHKAHFYYAHHQNALGLTWSPHAAGEAA